jgi:tetratricopeptide (TPR) repeat protein
MVKKAAEATPNQLLRAARMECNWTQKEVADRIGAPHSFNVSRWEQGTAFPSAHYIRQLCLLFGKSARELGLWVKEPGESNQLPTGTDSLPLWNVPFARNLFFTGRGPLLERLHEQLSQSHSAALNQSYALSGLGGIGKTQTAIEYIYRYREEYRAVFWVRAASRETLMADYLALARLLSLSGQDAQDQMQIVAATKRWLEQHEGWLLILDNADELSLLTDFLPTGGQGHLLLTTRAQATGKIAQSLSVEKMELSEGMQLLLRRAKVLAPEEPLDNLSAAVRKEAQQLVQELDGLPLALDQAGAYMEETGCRLSEYLQLYAQRRLALLQQQSSMTTDYPHTVASTWALSFAQVQQQGPAAADLLRLCAFLHPDAIPEAIMTEGAADLGPLLAPVAADALQFNGAIQLLRRYSLVKRDPEAKLLNMHRLVQVVLKENLDQATQREWAERSVRAVNAAFPEGEFAAWERCELCLPHALLCARWIEQYSFTSPEAVRLLHVAGFYLRERGQYAQAEPLLERAFSMREKVLGPEHLETASSLNELAWLYILHGKYQQAERLLQPALASFEHVLGPVHPMVAYALNSLASAYLYEGKYVEAEQLLQRVLAIGEALGNNHPMLADSLNSLANLYNVQGKYVQAEPLYQRAIAIDVKVLGSEHPNLATRFNSLAELYWNQGKYEQAEQLSQQALAIRQKALGAEHPDVALSLNNLAELYWNQGKYEQAEPLFHQALAIRQKALGAEHPDVAESLNNLALLYNSQGKYEQAEPLFHQALAIWQQALGAEHPNVATSLGNLAGLYRGQGKYEQAEQLSQQALAIRQKALGAEHPDVALSLNGLAELYYNQGKYEQAEPLFHQALAIRQKALGAEHPDVAQTLHHLAQLYEKQGKTEQAQPLYQRALAIREQALGPEHPDTVAVRANYTDLLGKMERLTEVVKQEGAE